MRAVFDGRAGGLLITEDPGHGILTCALPGGAGPKGEHLEPLVLKIPTHEAAARAVEREALLLVELRRMRLGPIERTIPRHVGMRSFRGMPAALASSLPGRPMGAEHHRRWRTAQPWLVQRDLRYAADWLARFQEASGTEVAASTWGSDVLGAVRSRWSEHPLLEPALRRVVPAAERLDGCPVRLTAVHGDFWHGNVLVDPERDTISGVVGWTAGEVRGDPLRDLARFAIRYSPDPDPRALVGNGWCARAVRAYLCAGLGRLGIAQDRWLDVAVAGVTEIAAIDQDGARAARHLAALAGVRPTATGARATVPGQRAAHRV